MTTYLRPLATREGLSAKVVDSFTDELNKIASDRKSEFKQWLKKSLVLAAGYGAGHGTGNLIGAGLSKLMKERPQGLKYLGPAAGLLGLASAYSYNKMHEHATKRDKK